MLKTKCWGNVWREHTYAQRPSSAYILGTACLRVLAKPGMVWIRTLTASMGARAMSAKNSALAEAARYNDVLQRYVFSCWVKTQQMIRHEATHKVTVWCWPVCVNIIRANKKVHVNDNEVSSTFEPYECSTAVCVRFKFSVSEYMLNEVTVLPPADKSETRLTWGGLMSGALWSKWAYIYVNTLLYK